MSKKNGNSKKALKPIDNKDFTHLNPLHIAVIDEYMSNGFNKVKSALTVKPGLSYAAANVLANTIIKAEVNQPYINQWQDQVKASTQIQASQLVRELITLSYSDITDYIDLSTEELKALPPEVRRCINSYDIKKKSYKNRDGKEITEETVRIKLNDKLKSLDMLSKYVGLYDADNKQKAPKVDIQGLKVEQLQVLLSIVDNSTKIEG